MGLFSKITSMILGSTEEQSIKIKKEVAYNTNKAIYPNEAKAVEQLVSSQYEKALEQILYTIGNSIRHHAKLSRADHIKNSPFMQRFVDHVSNIL